MTHPGGDARPEDAAERPVDAGPPGEGGAGGLPARLVLPLSPDRSLAALAAVVERWGADWEPCLQPSPQGPRPTTLCLPVQAGLRHGLLTLRVAVEPAPGGSELRLELTGEQWRLHTQAVALLVVAAGAGVAAALWPFFPALAGLVPLALVMGVGAWLVILSRLKNRGVRELLAEVAAAARAEAGGG